MEEELVKVIPFDPSKPNEIQKKLNEFAQEGWEVVGSHTYTDTKGMTKVYYVLQWKFWTRSAET